MKMFVLFGNEVLGCKSPFKEKDTEEFIERIYYDDQDTMGNFEDK